MRISFARSAGSASVYMVLAALLGATATGLTGCEKRPQVELVAGRPAPEFSLQGASGKNYRLEDFRGSVVILHFWASWCPPCVEEIPRWIQAAPSFGQLPVKLVAISVDEKWESALKIFPKDKVGPNMALLLDPTSEVSARYGTRQFPETYLLNSNLQVVEKWIGSQDWTSSRVRFAIARAMASTKQSGPAGTPHAAPSPTAPR